MAPSYARRVQCSITQVDMSSFSLHSCNKRNWLQVGIQIEEKTQWFHQKVLGENRHQMI
jgi:hypothetical protein